MRNSLQHSILLASIIFLGVHVCCEKERCGSVHIIKVLQREKYLCATRYDEKYFDFHCVPNGPPKQQDDGSGKLLPLEYYPLCGTDFENRAEYIVVIWGCCILFGFFFYQMAACSGSTPVDPVKIRRRVLRQYKPLSRDRSAENASTSSNYDDRAYQRESFLNSEVKKTQ